MTPARRVESAFFSAAVTRPHKTALVAGPRRVAYGALAGEAQALAARLRAAGVAAGDRVVLFLADPVLYAAAVHAVLAAGAAFVPLAPTTRSARLAFVLEDVGARVLLTEESLRLQWSEAAASASAAPAAPAGSTCPAAQRWPAVAVLSSGGGEAAFVACLPTGGTQARWRADAPPREAAPPAALACILYTSGTTGRPKGVMLAHAHMASAWDMVQAYLGLHEDDVIALPLAPTFSYGLYYLLMGLGLGATVVAEPMQAFPRVLLQRLAAERATVLPGVPMLFATLLAQRPEGAHDPLALPHLRLATNAAAALPPAHLLQLAERWPRASIFAMYGMTEGKRISFLPPAEIGRRPGSVGRGLAGQAHWLEDEHSRLRLGADAIGELVVRGPHVMAGYWARPQETAERLRRNADGSIDLVTGDLFRADGEGFLHFVGRRDDIIKSRGEKVAPQEVESAICALAGVREAAVVGRPDPLLGEAVLAYVVLRPGAVLGERDVIKHCLATLEPYMVPKEVQFVPELPRTDSGKLRRADLGTGAPTQNPPLAPAPAKEPHR